MARWRWCGLSSCFRAVAECTVSGVSSAVGNWHLPISENPIADRSRSARIAIIANCQLLPLFLPLHAGFHSL